MQPQQVCTCPYKQKFQPKFLFRVFPQKQRPPDTNGTRQHLLGHLNANEEHTSRLGRLQTGVCEASTERTRATAVDPASHMCVPSAELES